MVTRDANAPPPPHVRDQIAGLDLDPDKPLIISDADNVLLEFVAGLEAFLARHDLWLDLVSFRIHGNVKRRGSNAPVADEDVTRLLRAFYDGGAGDLAAVPGARDCLAALSVRAQIVVLTNVSPDHWAMRVRNLERRGFPYPVIANEGLKGPATAALSARASQPVFFIDDIPHNIASVRHAAPETVCIHYVADPRLDPLLPPAEGCDHRAKDWPDIAHVIDTRLSKHGF